MTTSGPSLNIAIDARWIYPKLSGIGLYTRELITALTQLDAPHRYTLLFHNPEVMARTMAETGFSHDPRFLPRLLGADIFSPSNQWALPLLLRKLGVNLYHSTNYMTPLLMPASIKRIVTIHDLIPLMFRDHAPRSKKNRLYPIYRRLMLHIGQHADAIITVSQSTRTDILNHLHLPPEQHAKIHVIPEGVHPRFSPLEPTPRNFPSDPVILFVGRRDPYKNLPLLIHAYALLLRQGVKARLRVIGPEDPRYPEARLAAGELGIEDHIEWSGYVNDPDLLRAYQTAAVYVLPSRYEGFGLPVLEAMACGTPVLCSRTSSLPEVGGNAALYIDPLDAPTCARHLSDLLTRPDQWAKRSQNAIAHASTYSWITTARETVSLYESLASPHPNLIGASSD
ncbi:MAG TPA: glycosyltransferase family 1 protein [Kiritimatiellia bacterium]|nr:glycosyltransferase family 1 protein [Kiritimatiellia bacterium]